MKLLDQYIDPADAAAARRRLREAGIASLVNPMDPHSVMPSKSGATHIGLWVLVDDQFDDAMQVLENPRHLPRLVLSATEIDAFEAAEVQRTRKQRLSDNLLVLFLYACLLALIVFTAVDFFVDL